MNTRGCVPQGFVPSCAIGFVRRASCQGLSAEKSCANMSSSSPNSSSESSSPTAPPCEVAFGQAPNECHRSWQQVADCNMSSQSSSGSDSSEGTSCQSVTRANQARSKPIFFEWHVVYVGKIGMRLEDFRTRHLNTSIGSICTGSDAAAYVMETLLGKDGCEELYACDQDPAAEQFILHNFNPKRFWRDSCEPSIGGRCQVLGGFATPLLVGPQMLFASSACKDNSILNGKRKTALLLPWCSENQRSLHDISAAIDAEQPDV